MVGTARKLVSFTKTKRTVCIMEESNGVTGPSVRRDLQNNRNLLRMALETRSELFRIAVWDCLILGMILTRGDRLQF